MKITFVTLFSRDMERTVAVHRLLGLAFIKEQHGEGPIHDACAGDELTMEIYPRTQASGSEDVMVGVEVTDLDKTRQTIASASLPLWKDIATVDGRRRLVIKDPDGRQVHIQEAC